MMLYKVVFLFFFISILLQAENKIFIKYPLTSINTERNTFQVSILKFLLDKSNIKYEIKSTSDIYSQSRAVKELQKGKKVNIFWMGTSAEVEKKLIPIRFPMYRGLIGHRVFIINKNDQSTFDKIKTLKQLQKFKGAQGIGWSDIPILEGSGLSQHVTKYENIFKMINKGDRISYFSRSLSEAYSEVSSRKDTFPNLAVEKNITLVYPFAMFFFVSPNEKKLADILTNSFNKSYKDGSFNKFFYEHPIIKNSIQTSNLKNRIRIDISNPFLTNETSRIDDRYWHNKFSKGR